MDPQFVDLDNDGHLDMLTGSYNPGVINWWRGSDKGFLPREEVPQEGYVKGARLSQSGDAPWSVKSNNYWNFTSARFGDFNGDGLMDLFVAGSGGPRVALNIGTKNAPKFGKREYLHFVDGKIVSYRRPSDETIKKNHDNMEYTIRSGAFKSYITPVDWDGDGVLDILATNEYYKKGDYAVYFWRGVQTDKGLRFENSVPLFTAADGSEKVLPGNSPQINIVDYNNDGVKDILMGLSMQTIGGNEIAPELLYKWTNDLGIQMPGKDVGRGNNTEEKIAATIKQIEEATNQWTRMHYLGNLDDYKYLTLRHRGYTLLFLGEKSTQSGTPKRGVIAGEKEVIEEIEYNNHDVVAENKNVKVTFTSPKQLADMFRTLEFVVKFDLADGYSINSKDTKVEITTNYKSLEAKPMVTTTGKESRFNQTFNVQREFYRESDEKELMISFKVTYQLYNSKGAKVGKPVTITKSYPLKGKNR